MNNHLIYQRKYHMDQLHDCNCLDRNNQEQHVDHMVDKQVDQLEGYHSLKMDKHLR